MAWLVLIILIILVIISYIVIILKSSEIYIFYPKKDHIYEPDIPHEKIMIEGKLSAWHFNNHPKNKTILFCHGNYGNLSYTDFLVEICDKRKLNLLVFDYSGYGYSKGIPSQRTVCQDGERAYRYLRQHVSDDDIVIWGMSLGGAVATHIASRWPCGYLVLMNTFSSLDDIILDANLHPGLNLMAIMISYLIDNMSSKDRIIDVKCPILIMHSKKDELIPFSNSQTMFDSIPHQCKKFIEIGGGHVSPIISQSMIEELFEFCCIDNSDCHHLEYILKDLPNMSDDFLKRERKLLDKL